MRIFETHAHLDFKDFDKDRDALINRCFKNGIEYIINIGTDENTSEKSVKLAEKYKNIYATVGYHPHEAKTYNEKKVIKHLSNKNVVAIGEIGLDFYRNHSPKNIQIEVFRKQLQIAKDHNLPVVVHDRDAHDDCLLHLKEFGLKKVIFHCFSGDLLFAEKLWSEGWLTSFTGTITYKNSALDNVILAVPKELFCIETDSPYLSPVPKRGKRNSPLNLTYIIERISEIKRLSPKLIAEQAFDNSVKFFLTK